MLFWIIVSVIVLVIAFFIYREFKEVKSYKENRQTKSREKQEDTHKDESKIQRRRERRSRNESQIKKRVEVEVEESNKKEICTLPQCQYPKFNYSRIMGLGLSEDEAIEFVQELIPQLKIQIPLIEDAIKEENFKAIEELTHSIKGSSTNIGTGGISDLLIEFNTYIKTQKELPVVEEYFKYLKYYTKNLEKEFA